jgi:hypothetical protein
MNNLSAEKALIFRITHIANVPWILANGLHCANSNRVDPNFIQIGNPDLIARRPQCRVPIAPGGTLSDYIPFYFTPFSPMLMNIRTGRNGVIQRPMKDIAIMVTSLREVQRRGIPFLFTDRHAVYQATNFYNDLDRLDQIPWAAIRARDFRRDPDDPGRFERYQAEALIHGHLPIECVLGVVCYGIQPQEEVQRNCDTLGLHMKVLCRPDWYL